ncbi:hypothetical protein PENSOL_c023G10656 [Penicillium solitum]|uniref:Protein kinase domain-containing protein n=1 Tax=Penicillium solitum TaxID=60172 RepID=A0A1V6R0V8_9EURO|nr:uncharacterized protein PENSOL_c023G10656 [Penicillium solitum]OQD94882.1 hypothetical protein PENSOL_c023G10656 [Penicillium solitum]
MASDLVTDSKLSVRFSAKHTHHVVFESDVRSGQRRQRKEESWERMEHLGKGGGGSVWLEQCLNVDSQPKTRAVKVIPKQTSFGQHIDYSRELEAIAKFSQTKYEDFFVRSLGWYEDANFAYIAMEYFELRDLQKCLKQPLPERETQQITHQLLEGLEQLHLNGYAHRDLKPAESPDWWVKIGDFGISKRVSDGQTYLRTAIGTDGFIAPEVLENDGSDSQYTAKVDMWSLGVLIHYMITKTLPFDNKRKLREYIRTGQFPSTGLASSSASKECHDFVIKGMMTTAASIRLSAKDALQHQWLRGLYASDPNREANGADGTQHGLAAQYINGKDRERASMAVSASLELTDASASWSGQIGTEPQPPVRIKNEVAQGPQDKPTALQHSTSTKRVLVSNLPNDLHTFHNEGLSLLGQRQYLGAKRMLQEAFKLRENALGNHHEDTLASLSALGDVLCGEEKYGEAEGVYRDAWEGRKQTLGNDHEDTLTSLHWLGQALYDQEKYAEAESVFRDTWDGRKHTLGKDHEDTLTSLGGLGDALYSQGEYAEAESVFRDAWKSRKQTLGKDHEHTLTSLNNLGVALLRQVEHAEAESVFRDAWEGRKQTLGRDHEHTLTSLHWLGQALYNQEKDAEAENMFRDAWEGRKQTLGKDHEATLTSLNGLGNALYSRGEYAEVEATCQGYT